MNSPNEHPYDSLATAFYERRAERPSPPRNGQVDKLITDLRTLLFPECSDLRVEIRRRIDSVSDDLRQLVEQSMIANPEDNQTGQTIDALVQTFLGKILPIREMLDSDANAAYEGDPAAQGTTEVESYYPGFEAVTVHRLAHELWNLKIPFLPRAMAERAHSSTGIDIHPGARIGREFFIDHGTGVVIGETTEIGNRVKLYQGVTLGALSFPTDAHGEILRNFKRHPTIEDDVVIYANATILGGDTVVGRGSVISADVDLRESVPPNSIVHGPEPVIEVSKRRSQA